MLMSSLLDNVFSYCRKGLRVAVYSNIGSSANIAFITAYPQKSKIIKVLGTSLNHVHFQKRTMFTKCSLGK